MLEKGMILPSLRLRELSGGELALDAGRGRHSLVLFLTHPAGCAPCEMMLRELMEGYSELVAEGAEIVAVLPAVPTPGEVFRSGPHPPFPVLVDADRSLDGGAAIVIADRFGEIFHLARAGERHHLPAVAEIAKWLAFIGVQCPE